MIILTARTGHHSREQRRPELPGDVGGMALAPGQEVADWATSGEDGATVLAEAAMGRRPCFLCRCKLQTYYRPDQKTELYRGKMPWVSQIAK